MSRIDELKELSELLFSDRADDLSAAGRKVKTDAYIALRLSELALGPEEPDTRPPSELSDGELVKRQIALKKESDKLLAKLEDPELPDDERRKLGDKLESITAEMGQLWRVQKRRPRPAGRLL